MNKKKLPKAIRRTTDDRQEAAVGHSAREQRAAAARPMDSNDPGDGGDAASVAGHASDAVGAAPAISPLVTGALVPAAPTPAEFDAAGRLSQARAIVERHTAYSAVGGLVPLPIANVASVTTIIVRMVKVLSDLYDVPFERDRARAIVVGLMGGAMPTGLAAVTTSTLVYIVPGSNLIGLAVSSIAAVACTRSIGRIFVEHFESGATLQGFSASDR